MGNVMPAKFQRISTCLWFDDQGEEAANFYISIFDNARIVRGARYTKEGAQASGQPEGSVMTVLFELDGHEFLALNGGPAFQFNEAVSIIVNCETQEEVDRYWNRLSEGGDEKAQQCGWLKDKYGVSWQIVPALVAELVADPDPEIARKANEAILKMKKIDIEELRQAVK